jgi:aryl-alcohol dehydrogenase-like predicted oxidoreductase
MRTIILGHTGQQVSALCLGCMYFGSSISEAQSFELLDVYQDAGGSFLDTANNYAFWVDGCQGGESERLIGRWFKARQNRPRTFVATKVGYNMPPRVPASLARATIVEQCENSLRQLQTDYIDLYYAHTDRREPLLEEVLGAFDQLVRQGKVRYIGCSNILAWRIVQARALSQQRGWAEYCCVQQRHSYLRPKTGITAFSNTQVPVNVDLLDYAATNVGSFTVLAYSTLLGGVYSDPQHRIPEDYQPDEYDAADMRARLQTLRQIADEMGATPNQVVLAWLTQNSPAMIALISSGSRERLQENLGATKVTLTAEQLVRLNQASA